ncbi:hypothetical protein [Bacillus paramycoides]
MKKLGDIQLITLANGKITVSPQGAEYLVKQLQQYQVK